MILFKTNHLLIMLVVFNTLDSASCETGSKIPEFIQNTLSQFNSKNIETNDIALIRINQYSESKEHVCDLFCAIIEKVGNKNVIFIPPINSDLERLKIRQASFVIIVSDLYNKVKRMTKPFARLISKDFFFPYF